MSQHDQARWDEQHGQTTGSQNPSEFLRQIIEADAWPLLRGKALDVACGKGRNSLYLAARGFDVVAIDISAVAIDVGRSRAASEQRQIEWRQADLEEVQLEHDAYELIVNFNYLQRSLVPQLKHAVKIGGCIIFETYLIDQKDIGHPKNPDYLLGHNELLDYFRDFRVLYYREGKFFDDHSPSFRAGVLAQRVR
jgi:2-polyprenyl-3-methyl-5-hydroxy-6-metoxy-1,4-benzoquinol methylase